MAEASVSAQRAEVLMDLLGEELTKLKRALDSQYQSSQIVRPDFLRGTRNVNQHPPVDEVRNSLSELKCRFKEFCEEEFNKIPPHVEGVQSFPTEPQTREEFLKYFRHLTLDPNTAHRELVRSKNNRVMRYSERDQGYPDHPERFDSYIHALSKESVYGRCYWEVEWTSDIGVAIAVVYRGIGRKGWGDDCMYSRSNQAWSLEFPSVSSVYFYHNHQGSELRAPASSRIGVYVDHSAGTLSFYSISDTMKLLHRVNTTFTEPLYAAFAFYPRGGSKSGRIMMLCDPQ